jgi:3-oxoacyl-[acyl-carrier-protein] synthase-1
MITSVGLDAPKTTAAVRAGMARFRETSFYDQRGKPIFMATVPDEDLAPLDPSLEDDEAITERQAQMLRLAGTALREALEEAPDVSRIPLLLALPEAHPRLPAPRDAGFLRKLAVQSGVGFDMAKSKVAAGGRASGIALVAEGLERLASRAAPLVVVGGVDSYQDADLLAALDEEDRIRAVDVLDGFTPGEGAAFLLLGPPGSAHKARRKGVARIDAAATGEEPGHRYSSEPYRGEGLDAAFRALFAQAAAPPIPTVFAGLNGESFNAKEWGVAALRHQARLSAGFRTLHPADCLGDTGAASGPLMLGLSAIGIEKGHRRSPCLVWCSSDHGGRGAALVSASAGE